MSEREQIETDGFKLARQLTPIFEGQDLAVVLHALTIQMAFVLADLSKDHPHVPERTFEQIRKAIARDKARKSPN